jgi:DNA-binding MarR family transcriptional regulator
MVRTLRREPAAGTLDEGEAVSAALSELVTQAMMFHRQWARQHGFTPFQFAFVKVLQAQGPQQPSQIAAYFGISRPAVSSELNALERSGWVERTHPPANRRTQLISLTPKARRVIEGAMSEYRAEILRGLDGVPASQRAQLMGILTTLVTRLRKLGAESPKDPSGGRR